MPATPAWPPKSAPRLFIPQRLSLGMAHRVDGNAAHYLAQVMRVQPGDAVILCDDQTGEWAARVVATSKSAVDLNVAAQLRGREDAPDFWLCFAPVKKPHFDLILEKATELGVARIIPVLTRRCVVDKVNEDRARTILTEAAEQCARTALPQLAPLTPLAALLREWPAGRTLFFADEQGGDGALAAFHHGGASAGLLVG
ncbi:MAG: RsmE family RNA methyltransferase, partial [Sphingopyxis sp.]